MARLFDRLTQPFYLGLKTCDLGKFGPQQFLDLGFALRRVGRLTKRRTRRRNPKAHHTHCYQPPIPPSHDPHPDAAEPQRKPKSGFGAWELGFQTRVPSTQTPATDHGAYSTPASTSTTAKTTCEISLFTSAGQKG
jgi:hypothetical protein